MRLNLGSGTDVREGFTNVDIRQLDGIDVVADARKLPFGDNEAELILGQDLIEHVPYLEVEDTLKEWFRVLSPNGVIELRTPDFSKIMRAFISRRLPEDEGFRLFFGDQSPEAGGYEAGGHKSGKSMLQWLETMKRLGFDNVTVEPDDFEYNIWIRARKPNVAAIEPVEDIVLEEAIV